MFGLVTVLLVLAVLGSAVGVAAVRSLGGAVAAR